VFVVQTVQYLYLVPRLIYFNSRFNGFICAYAVTASLQPLFSGFGREIEILGSVLEKAVQDRLKSVLHAVFGRIWLSKSSYCV